MKPEILPEERVSRRRLSLPRRMVYALLAPVGLLLLRTWWRSCRIVAVVGAEHLDAALARAPSLLPCYWHQHELFCGRYLLLQSPRGLKVGFLISPSVDGEVPAKIAHALGAQVIRGSSTRTGARALRDYYQLLVTENVSPVLTPDGPTGPPFVFKSGGLLLAQISGRPLLPMAYAASRAWFFGWDQFVLPWPFSRIAIAIGAPVHVEKSVALNQPETLALWQERMQRELHELFETAREALP
ncbi:MAG TPA: lysophospholipid acyltransferase family protein [Steroidobacteraceae bacterium]|nr:lysophospholipid acyltransferase family protein [Steroidobacteraceae bacterium]